jgi:O-antigen/teichoic acid export membrane protein
VTAAPAPSPAHAPAPAAAPAGGLVASANSLLLSTGASAVLGAVFWIVAARLFDAGEVGRDSALIGAMVELSTICQLNLDNVLVRFLPGVRAPAGRVVAGAYGVNAVLALVLGTAFVLVVPSVSGDFAFLRDDGAVAFAFVAGLVLWGVFTLQDAALTAMRRARWVAVENTAFGVLKLTALPLAVALSVGHGVFLAWIVPMALLLVPVNLLVFRRAVTAHRAAPAAAPGDGLPALERGHLRAFLAQDYLGQVLMRLGVTLLPVLVVATLGAQSNAYFYIPFTIVIACDMMVLSIGTSIVAEAAYDARLARDHVRTALRRYGPPLLAGVAVLVAAAPLVLLPFGTDYAREGAGVLRLLALAIVPRALIFLAGAVWRLQGHGRWLLGAEALMLVVLLGPVVPLADGLGLTGVALAWLGSATAAGLLAGLWLLRFLHAGPAAPHPNHDEDR